MLINRYWEFLRIRHTNDLWAIAYNREVSHRYE
jgi:hypothetical protein